MSSTATSALATDSRLDDLGKMILFGRELFNDGILKEAHMAKLYSQTNLSDAKLVKGCFDLLDPIAAQLLHVVKMHPVRDWSHDDFDTHLRDIPSLNLKDFILKGHKVLPAGNYLVLIRGRDRNGVWRVKGYTGRHLLNDANRPFPWTSMEEVEENVSAFNFQPEPAFTESDLERRIYGPLNRILLVHCNLSSRPDYELPWYNEARKHMSEKTTRIFIFASSKNENRIKDGQLAALEFATNFLLQTMRRCPEQSFMRAFAIDRNRTKDFIPFSNGFNSSNNIGGSNPTFEMAYALLNGTYQPVLRTQGGANANTVGITIGANLDLSLTELRYVLSEGELQPFLDRTSKITVRMILDQQNWTSSAFTGIPALQNIIPADVLCANLPAGSFSGYVGLLLVAKVPEGKSYASWYSFKKELVVEDDGTTLTTLGKAKLNTTKTLLGLVLPHIASIRSYVSGIEAEKRLVGDDSCLEDYQGAKDGSEYAAVDSGDDEEAK